MVAIKDFGMPSCCENCNMCNNRNLDTFYCCITLNDVNIDEKAHDCPLVEIEERKVGKWITKDGKEQGYDIAGIKTWYKQIMCNKCGFIKTALEGYAGQRNYCPNCGAEMRGSEK